MIEDLIIICGPTASGKTGLSIEVAKAFNGEVISADSMQIYRTLDVGTAKISENEKQGVMHHLIDVVDPNKKFTVAEYVEMARKVIADVNSRGKTPIVVGGTGLYINSLVFGYDFSETSENTALRKELKEFCEREGNLALYERLKQISPQRAEKLHPNDVKRVIRAIEASENHTVSSSGGNIVNENAVSSYKAVMIVPPRELLYERINKRVDEMISSGLENEVRSAIENFGLTTDSQSMQAIGYKEWFDYFEGKASLDECIERIKRATRNYAKRQLTWFKKFPNIRIYEELDVDRIIAELQK